MDGAAQQEGVGKVDSSGEKFDDEAIEYDDTSAAQGNSHESLSQAANGRTADREPEIVRRSTATPSIGATVQGEEPQHQLG